MSSDIKSSSVESKGCGFLDLPEEIQKEIFSHCSQSDWINLCLVSNHFRDLAADQLYRSFHIVFPDEDDDTFDSPIDGLAGGLDTFVTSEYNYAKHLRDLSLDTLSSGLKAEQAYKSYLFNVSCGKFMNTLLLLTLRKAKSLDTFKWNIRVELSRPVYKALHDIKSLRHLHLRLQEGPSLYGLPPPPKWGGLFPNAAFGMMADQVNDPFINPAVSTSALSIASQAVGQSTSTSAYRSSSEGGSKKHTLAKEPATLGGFKRLETLAILDIDNLTVRSEIRSCVRNSFSTLRKLKLSFSDSLASQARKPNLEADPEDSDQEDDFQVVAVPPAQYNDSGPAKIFRAREEQKFQETVLGYIFEIEPCIVKEHEPTLEEPSKGDKEQTAKDAGQTFIDAVEKASKAMWSNLQGSSEFDIMSQQEIMEQIVKAAKRYVEFKETPTQENTSIETAEAAPVAAGIATSGSAQHEGFEEQGKASPSGNAPIAGYALFGYHANAEDDDTKPEDIDVAAPEEQLGIDGQDESNAESQLDDPVDTKSQVDTHKEIQPWTTSSANSGGRITEMIDHLINLNLNKKKANHEANVGAETNHSKAEAKPMLDDKEELHRQVTDYARGTRGIALQSLAIHLIPTKASVLGRAVDLRTLKEITLLNVGMQAPIWAMMMKENKLQPLPLQKIFTDNVCPYFLQFVSQLQRVEEILMLERGHKSKPESFAPKTRINIAQIRRTILKKHMETLKILMIKNESSYSWDLDEKTMQLVCKRGKVLRELTVAVGIRAMHTFLQHMPNLTNLFALHFVSFRSDDTCVSVMRELQRFIVDTLWQYPELKLEWTAMGDEGRAQHIMRRPDSTKKAKKNKESWKAPPIDANGHLNESGYPVFPANGWEPESESDEDLDESAFNLVVADNILFYDIWGVHIFEKEIVAGRL